MTQLPDDNIFREQTDDVAIHPLLTGVGTCCGGFDLFGTEKPCEGMWRAGAAPVHDVYDERRGVVCLRGSIALRLQALAHNVRGPAAAGRGGTMVTGSARRPRLARIPVDLSSYVQAKSV